MGRIGIKLGLNLCATLGALGTALLSKKIIDDAVLGSISQAMVFIFAYFGLIIFMQVLSSLSALLSTMLDEKFSFGIRKQLYEKIINADWRNVTKYHTGDLMTRMTSDVGNVASGIVWTIPDIIQLLIELLLVFCTLFYYSAFLAIFALLIAPIAAIAAFWLGKKLRKLQVKVQETESTYRSFLQESFANLLVVKSFANEEYYTDRLVNLRQERFFWVFQKAKVGIITSSVMSLAFQIGYICALAYGAIQVSTGRITFGTMSLFLTLVNRVQTPIFLLAQQIPRVVSVFASAGRIIELQEIQEEEKERVHIRGEQVGLSIQKLTFGYTEDAILDETSIEIKSGEFVAIVGESGIGKTTLIRLIMSFLHSEKGKIYFTNEQGDKENSNAGIRRFLSYVPQGNTLFSGTIHENIKMGKLDASEEEIMEALKLASAYEFVAGLAEGIHTVIGERGYGLSEGQAQRIAIARAFIRRAPFLILDEATSALDEVTEIQVLQNLHHLNPRPTCLIITHRKSILEYCDREMLIEHKQLKLNTLQKVQLSEGLA